MSFNDIVRLDRGRPSLLVLPRGKGRIAVSVVAVAARLALLLPEKLASPTPAQHTYTTQALDQLD